MTGIETNVLVRYIVGDDEKQAAAAEEWLTAHCDSEEPGWVSVIVMCELAWVLQRGYGYGRERVAKVLKQITQTAELEVEDHELVRSAVKIFAGGQADFADGLLALRNREHGVEKTVTFDRKAACLPHFDLLH